MKLNISNSDQASTQGSLRELSITLGGLLIPLVVSLITLSPMMTSQAYADDEFAQARELLRSYQQKARGFAELPQQKYLVPEFATLNEWFARAERLLREEEEDEFVRLVGLIKAQVRLIEVSVTEVDERYRLLQLHRDTVKLEEKAKRERESIVELERQMGGVLDNRRQQAQPAPTAPRPAPAAPAQPSTTQAVP